MGELRSMTLSQLLSGIVDGVNIESQVNDLTSDSRQAGPGVVFLAYPGYQGDGRDFIADAIDRHAAAILYESPYAIEAACHKAGIPMIAIPSLSSVKAQLAARFFGDASRAMVTIGVTGTNGKTSCVDFIAQAISNQGMPCGSVGTLGCGLWPSIEHTGMTTPDSIELQRQLAVIKSKGATHLAMEVSSHALAMGRVDQTEIDIAVFTQLSRDHLDFHRDMSEYEQVKMSLFRRGDLSMAVVNADDATGLKIIEEVAGRIPVIGISMASNHQSEIPMVVINDLVKTRGGFNVELLTPWGRGWVDVPLLGTCNLYNVMSLVATLGCLKWSWSDIVKAVEGLCPVTGRMHTLGGGNLPLVVVDYAHTPDALDKLLSDIKQHVDNKLMCVFGCGGNRDTGKRPLMAKIAEEHASNIIITTDNPRFEDPQAIVDDIVRGLDQPAKAEVILDRADAITNAIDSASPGDVVVIAGKGHESFQIIEDNQLPFSDIKVVEQILNKRGCSV